MKIVGLDSKRAIEALETVRFTKKPDAFINASITIGEEQAQEFKRNLALGDGESFPVFYKLRDSRYGILGFKKELPKASYYPVTTYRYGDNYEKVNVEIPQATEIKDDELLGFYDPMLSRGTTCVTTMSAICNDGQVNTLSTFHFFAAEKGISRLQVDLRKFFLEEYLMVIGQRGFEVDASGYMGAILREQDYGDVMEGTWWKEYSPKTEQEIVENNICKGADFEIVIGYTLFLLLKHRNATSRNFTPVLEKSKELPTVNWINLALFRLKQMGAHIPVNDWAFIPSSIGRLPVSLRITEAIRQLEREWLIEKTVKERMGRRYYVYHITPWGDSYLKEVFLPVFGRKNLLNPFVPFLEDATPAVIVSRFKDLLSDVVLETN